MELSYKDKAAILAHRGKSPGPRVKFMNVALGDESREIFASPEEKSSCNSCRTQLLQEDFNWRNMIDYKHSIKISYKKRKIVEEYYITAVPKIYIY